MWFLEGGLTVNMSTTGQSGAAAGEGRAATVAMIFNVQTPYRLHLQRRLVREIPEVRFSTLFTHDQADQAWEREDAADINPVHFGAGHPVAELGHRAWLTRDWAKAARIIAWLVEHDAKAVFIGGYNDITRLRIIAWCHRAGVPCFMVTDSNSRGDLATGVKAVVKRLVIPRVIDKLTGVMVCGRLGAEYAVKYGAAPEQVFTCPYEPDYGLIARVTQAQAGAAAAKHGLAAGRKRIVTCCRLIDVKRVDLVIDAFQAVASERPEFDLVVIGNGPLLEALRARVRADLLERVVFTGFIGDQTEISALYRAAHVFVLASNYEPWGVVVNEAAAAGLAMVCSDVVGAAAELVRDGINGRTFPSGNLEALTAAVRETADAKNLERYRAGSATVLAEWRREGDPVAGMRAALRYAGVAVSQP